MIILINSSKTMVAAPGRTDLQTPALLDQAIKLDAVLKKLTPARLKSLMHLSPNLATATRALIQGWSSEPEIQTAALDAFQGDIYKGLLADTLTEADRIWANDRLRILSGLYGVLRPFDGIAPYRLELMYSLKGQGFSNLYQFWGDAVAQTLPESGPIVDLASDEYARLVRPFVAEVRVIGPLFLSVMPNETEAKFVVVHAKVARGAFARWMITERIDQPGEISRFCDLGYVFDPEISSSNEPTFVKRLT